MVLVRNVVTGFLLYCLCTVVDVSAQTNCVISPTSLTTLTIHSKSRMVELNCQCMDGDEIITGARWFINNTLLPIQDDGALFFDTFTGSNSGTYTCSPNSTFPTIPPGDTITLNAADEYILYTVILFGVIN